MLSSLHFFRKNNGKEERMRAPKPKSDEFIELLIPSLLEGKNLLCEFEKRRIIAGAKKIPERYQGLCIEGLVRIICGELEDGVNLCERSLLFAPNEPVTWANYALAFANKGLHSRQIDVLKRAIVATHSPNLVSDILIVASFWIDMDLLKKVVPMFLAMEIQPNESRMAALRNYEKLLSIGDDVKDVEAVAKAVMSVAEKHNLPPINSQVSDDGYGMLAFTFVVKTDDADFLSMLNNELIDVMVEKGLETSNCIGYFEPKGE